jgi:hypothetical protein
MAKTKTEVIEDFIEAFSHACNETEILYQDMVYQEDLFVFQEKVVDALLDAHKNGLFTQETLLKFNHVFSLKAVDIKK